MKHRKMNYNKSKRLFNRTVNKTHISNVKPVIRRGGYSL